MTSRQVERFSAKEVEALRKRVAKISHPGNRCPSGWSISPVNPIDIIGMFEPLRMKPEYVLHAYQFETGGNGNGVVWALPRGCDLPDPEECPRVKGRFVSLPKPPFALDNVMEAIDGDGTPFSYLCASIAARELAEFGAMWHGVSWWAAKVLGSDPRAENADPSGSVEQPSDDGWRWYGPKPECWEPQVEFNDDTVLVSFLTFTTLGEVTISRITDRFAAGSYVFESEEEVLASGGVGYIP